VVVVFVQKSWEQLFQSSRHCHPCLWLLNQNCLVLAWLRLRSSPPSLAKLLNHHLQQML
ncbi:hypothetical protein SK128_003008, partial [Halocaridina rubra]